MDTEQQIRLNFLEEVEDYFDQIEAVVLTLTVAELDTAQLDRAMRAAHSIKGGAAMMSFAPLSQIAHRLEDFFKILRVRPHGVVVNDAVESLLLQGVDALRLASQYSRQGIPIDGAVMETEIQPIFEELQLHLGTLRPEDEDLLLAQEENVDIATIIFSSGVEEYLEDLESQLTHLSAQEIAVALAATAEQLSEFGRMSELDAFVYLCESIQSYIPQISIDFLPAFSQEALATWQRFHALVLLGQTNRLPQAINIEEHWLQANSQTTLQHESALNTQSDSETLPWQEDHTNVCSVSDTRAVDSRESAALVWLDEVDEADLQDLQSFFSDAETERSETNPSLLPDDATIETSFSQIASLPDLWLDEADAQSGAFQDSIPAVLPIQDEEFQAQPQARTVLGTEHRLEILPEAEHFPDEEILAEPFIESTRLTAETLGPVQNTTTVRVSAQQLQQLNTLFGKLIVERNAINLRFSQLHNLVSLMQDRMGQLEQSNHQLRSWYDQASMESLIVTSAPHQGTEPERSAHKVLANFSPKNSLLQVHQHFDALEFDHYTDLHLISQEQMEQIVQLQEVTNDIALSLREASTATSDLNYTTQALQSGMTKIQMRPFSTLVKRFPRVVRDLSLQYDKPVDLTIEGEMTLIDRVAVEALADPLNHILRNAFDHGIEPTEERIALGKTAEGKIKIRAMHRGNQALVTVQDDGRGIDLEKVRSRLQGLGMSEAEVQQLEDQDLLAMIFEPGFTTAEHVTELSGRGVGMDIAYTNLQQVRGDIRVDTQLGKGTTFTIQVPLAVSVLRVMLVESARMVFAVPIDSIKSMTSLPSGAFGDGQQSLVWEGQTVKLVRLGDWLRFSGTGQNFEMDGKPTIAQPTVLIVNQGESLHGFCIDRFWGEQEISLSPLKSPVPLPKYFSGMSILGDGRVVPLVDPFQLLEWVQRQQVNQFDQPIALSAGPARENSRFANPQFNQLNVPVYESANQVTTLLIVDDSVNVRRYLALTLERAGYQVEQAKDGQEAVDKLLAGLEVKAVICDIEMPRLDGYGVLSELRSQPKYKQLPIAMLTSRMNDKHRKLAMNLGASAYFSKPYNDQELLKTLQELLSRAENSEQSQYEPVTALDN